MYEVGVGGQINSSLIHRSSDQKKLCQRMLHLRKHTPGTSLVSGPVLNNVFVQAIITNYCRLDDLNIKHLFLTILEARMSKIKMLADLVLARTHFLVCI